MAKCSHSSESLEDILREEKIVDFDSDTVESGGEDPDPDTLPSHIPSHIAPNTFPGRSTALAPRVLRATTTLNEPIITNKLDEQQQHFIDENERAGRLS